MRYEKNVGLRGSLSKIAFSNIDRLFCLGNGYTIRKNDYTEQHQRRDRKLESAIISPRTLPLYGMEKCRT